MLLEVSESLDSWQSNVFTQYKLKKCQKITYYTGLSLFRIIKYFKVQPTEYSGQLFRRKLHPLLLKAPSSNIWTTSWSQTNLLPTSDNHIQIHYLFDIKIINIWSYLIILDHIWSYLIINFGQRPFWVFPEIHPFSNLKLPITDPLTDWQGV